MADTQSQNDDEQRVLLRVPDIAALTGWCDRTILNKVRRGQFLPPARFGGRTKVWFRDQVMEYLANGCLKEQAEQRSRRRAA